MDLEKELKAIAEHFSSISDEEFSKAMKECGAGRILATQEIAAEQVLYKAYTPNSKLLGDMAGEYKDYNDGIRRDVAA